MFLILEFWNYLIINIHLILNFSIYMFVYNINGKKIDCNNDYLRYKEIYEFILKLGTSSPLILASIY